MTPTTSTATVPPPPETPARVLLTGFEPFGGDATNPSWAAASDAAEILRAAGLHARAVQIPCVFAASAPALQAALAEHCPDVVVCVGLAGGTAQVRLERVAVNLQDARIPDNAGDQPVDRPVAADGPAALFSTLPVKRALTALQAAGIPAQLSLSAGSFVCNHLMYSVLHAPGSARAAGFVHVPWDLEHRADASVPALPAAQLAQAVAVVARESLDASPDADRPGGALH